MSVVSVLEEEVGEISRLASELGMGILVIIRSGCRVRVYICMTPDIDIKGDVRWKVSYFDSSCRVVVRERDAIAKQYAQTRTITQFRIAIQLEVDEEYALHIVT